MDLAKKIDQLVGKLENKEPTCAEVRVRFLDNGGEFDTLIVLQGSEVEGIPDDEVFFYCTGVSELKSLCIPGEEDFVVTKVYNIY